MKIDNKILRRIVNKNFTWGDLNPKYDNLSQLVGNVFCPFHEHNFTEGNSKFYFNEEKGIWTLHCWVESRNYDAYDYLNLILCQQKQKYISPLEFLKIHMPEHEILRQYEEFEKQDIEFIETNLDKKKTYIDNVYNESEDIIDYVERLYTA